MKLQKLALAPIAAAIVAFSMDVGATSWVLNVSDGHGTGPFGTVTATQGIDANHVDVSVTLDIPPVIGFVHTGQPDNHNAFVFNLASDSSPGVVQNLTAGFVSGLGGTNTPFGLFSNSIICILCGNGGSNPQPGPLNFTVEDLGGINPGSFIGSFGGVAPGGWLFSADILVAASGSTGAGTYNVATNTPAIPEPETYAMMLAGLSLLGFVARRRKQNLGSLASV